MSFDGKKGKGNGKSNNGTQQSGTTQGRTQQVRPQQQGSTQQQTGSYQQGGQSQKAPVSAEDMKRLFADFKSDIKSSFGDKIDDHEARIKKLEELAGVSATSTPNSATAASSGSANPSPDPGPAAASQSASTAPNPASQSVAQSDAPCNGAGYAYKYWDYKSRTWCLSVNIWAAKQASNGVYTPVWVWYKNGVIDHILSEEELRKYAP